MSVDSNWQTHANATATLINATTVIIAPVFN